MASVKGVTKVAIIPGNGDGDVENCNWYAWVRDALRKLPGVDPVLRNMPDPALARETIWIPFMRGELHCEENTIIIGHSSGAEAAMRFAERYKVKGIILVSAYVTHLGSDYEKASGYFDRPWEWDKIRSNVKFVIQFGSTDDPFVPWSEQQEVADCLKTELRKFTDRGHFLDFKFPEAVHAVKKIISQHNE